MESTKGTILPCTSTISCSPLALQVSMRMPLALAKSWGPHSSTAESIRALEPATAFCRWSGRVTSRLDHPAAEKAVFGQAVRARQEQGGGWMGWAVSVDDLAPYEKRLERESVPGNRTFPDGRHLEWRQIGIKGLMADPQLPFFIKWTSPAELLPSSLSGNVTLASVEVSGSRQRVENWLGETIPDEVEGITFDFTSPNGHPGIDAVTFDTPSHGRVRI